MQLPPSGNIKSYWAAVHGVRVRVFRTDPRDPAKPAGRQGAHASGGSGSRGTDGSRRFVGIAEDGIFGKPTVPGTSHSGSQSNHDGGTGLAFAGRKRRGTGAGGPISTRGAPCAQLEGSGGSTATDRRRI